MPREVPLVRVGLVVLAGLAVTAGAIFVIGQKDFLFTRKNRYYTEFESVNNLAAGNPVQLNGVDVGKVEQIILPEDMGETRLQIWLTVDERFAPRIREDSLARIQTLGLLGDKYISITSGTPGANVIPPGGQIPAAPATEIDQIIASGGDIVQNLSVAASSLSQLLTRMERGEGLLGVLVTEREGGPQLADTVSDILSGVQDVVHDLQSGQGTLGRLVYDDALANRLDATVTSLQSLLARVDEGDGLLPRLLSDPEMGERLGSAIERFDDTTGHLKEVAAKLDEGEGLIPRLVGDEKLADELTQELEQLLESLNTATEKLNRGEGTAALLLNDPAVYDAITDILVGIDESRLLRWLLRNRQKAGIKHRYEETRDQLEAAP